MPQLDAVTGLEAIAALHFRLCAATPLVFLIGTPKQHVTEYLQLVAAISRFLKTEGIRAALLAAEGEEELRGTLARAMNVAV